MSEKNIEDKKLYELGFHIVPSIAEGKISDEVENLKKSLTKIGAEIVKEGETKLIDLAYEITKKIDEANQRFNTAYFGWIKFNATAEAVETLKQEVDTNAKVLRYLLVKTVDDDEHSTAKIVDENKKESKDDTEGKESDKKPKESNLEEPTAEEDAKNSGEKAVDEAIDKLVE